MGRNTQHRRRLLPEGTTVVALGGYFHYEKLGKLFLFGAAPDTTKPSSSGAWGLQTLWPCLVRLFTFRYFGLLLTWKREFDLQKKLRFTFIFPVASWIGLYDSTRDCFWASSTDWFHLWESLIGEGKNLLSFLGMSWEWTVKSLFRAFLISRFVPKWTDFMLLSQTGDFFKAGRAIQCGLSSLPIVLAYSLNCSARLIRICFFLDLDSSLCKGFGLLFYFASTLLVR